MLIATAGVMAAATALADPGGDSHTMLEAEVAARAISMIEEKVAERRPVVQRRLRALYRTTRVAGNGLFDAAALEDRNRVAVELARLVRSDLVELDALVGELDRVQRGAGELAKKSDAPTTSPPPTLSRPIAGARVVSRFGERREGALRLSSRGIDLAATSGVTVIAPVAGNVVYRGSIRGIGASVIIDSGEHWVVLGPIDRSEGGSSPAVGARVTRGETLGQLLGERLHLELRVQNERGGTPIDPSLVD